MAGRLESHGSIIMQVRVSADTRQIATDWQARDVRRGTPYNIRAVEEDKSRAIFDLLAESNVNTG